MLGSTSEQFNSSDDLQLGKLVTRRDEQVIPLTAKQFWSGFDDYLALQRMLGGHSNVVLVTGAGRPFNGVSAVVEFDFMGSKTREILLQKDDLNHIWVMGIPEPNVLFNYYRATATTWDTDAGARAALSFDVVLRSEEIEQRAHALQVIAAFLPTRIPEVCRFVLHRDGLRGSFTFDVNAPLASLWARVGNWDDVSWVMGATGTERIGPKTRKVDFGNVSIEETYITIDSDTHQLVYQLTRSTMPVRMYEGTVTLTAASDTVTTIKYDNVMLLTDTDNPAVVHAQINAMFAQRFKWVATRFGTHKT